MSAEEVCARKAVYPSLAKARQEARKILQEKRRRLRPYLCWVCQKYHLTSDNPNAIKKGVRVQITRKGYSTGIVVSVNVRDGTVRVQPHGVPYIVEMTRDEVIRMPVPPSS